MNIRVAYSSKTGNTKKVAEAIAAAAGCKSDPIKTDLTIEKVDVLFIGCAVYATTRKTWRLRNRSGVDRFNVYS